MSLRSPARHRGLELVHALGTSAKLPGSLRAAQQQNTEQSGFSAREVEYFLETVLIFSDTAIGAARRTSKSHFLQSRERIAHSILIQVHHWVSIVLLVAGVDQGVERQRIVVGSRDVFLDERA